MSPVRTVRSPALRYRPARRTDVENLAELGFRAYRVHSVEKRRDFYTDHPRFGLRDVRVGELDGQLVASLIGAALAIVSGIGVSPYLRRPAKIEADYREEMRDPEGETIYDRAQMRAAASAAASAAMEPTG